MANRHVQPLPDGKFFQFRGDSRVFKVVGGSFVYVNSWAHLPFQAVATVGWEHYGFNLSGIPVFTDTPVDGTFVMAPDTGRVYRFVGGAPIYIDSWAPFGGPQPVQLIPPAAIAGAGTGQWVNLRQTPKDGTFVVEAGHGRVYRYIGGAAVYINSWAEVGGVQPHTLVPAGAISAAESGPWSNLRRTPADGTVMSAGRSFQYIDGAAIPLPGPEWQYPRVEVPLASINRAGQWPWDNLRPSPRDGKFVVTKDGNVYRFAGGAAFRVYSWAPFGGPQPLTEVYAGLPVAVSDGAFVVTAEEGNVYRFAGRTAFFVDSWAQFGGVQPHTVVSSRAVMEVSRPQPVNGTVVVTAQDGRIYQYAGGAAIYVSDWDPIAMGSQGVTRLPTVVSAGAIDQAGTGPWSNLRAVPEDGTPLIEAGSEEWYFVIGGAPVWWDPAFPRPQVINAIPVRVNKEALDNVGVGPWANLRSAPVDGTIVRTEVFTCFEFRGTRIHALVPRPANCTDMPRVSRSLIAGAGTGRWWGMLPAA